MEPDASTRWLATCGVVGAALFVVVFAIDGATRPGYDARLHPVSALSLGEGGWVQIANFLAAGALFVAASVGWHRALEGGAGAKWAPRLLATVGLGLMAAGVFVTDPELGYPPGVVSEGYSWHGNLHGLAALFVFGALTALGFVFARRLRQEGRPRWANASAAAGILVLAFFIATGIAAALPAGGPVGLLQRVSVVSGLGLVAAISLSIVQAQGHRA